MNFSFTPTFNPSQSTPIFFPASLPHISCKTWEEMRAIQFPEVNFTYLERSPVPAPQTISEILGSNFQGVQGAIDGPEDIEDLAAYFDIELDLQSSDAGIFYSDLMEIAENFFRLSGAKRVGVKLENVTTDNCRLFHVDKLGLRLFTTYRGASTEWLKNENAIRSGLGQGENHLIQKPGCPVEKMCEGWVGLMKGEGYVGNKGNGFIHRSPAIESTKGRRLTLRMDTLA